MIDPHERLREFWDRDAPTYDRSASHAASTPAEAAAWRSALLQHLPPPPARLLDVGAGTGAISLLAAELGHRVTAMDISPTMLDRARAKAEDRGLALETVEASATEPPPGPFDAVLERHLLWTTPRPVEALAAWRRVAPGGRLVLFEALVGRASVGRRVRGAAARGVRRLLRVPPDHHGSYDPDLLASLPLARTSSPGPLLQAVEDAGWRRIRLERLGDVEWARVMMGRRIIARLESVPQFAVVADDA